MGEGAILDYLVRWVIEHVPEGVAVGLLIPVLGRIASFPAVRVEFVGRCTLTDYGAGEGGDVFLKWVARASNKGSSVAVNCIPQLQRFPGELFGAQYLQWGKECQIVPAKVEPVNIPPRDETQEFMLAWSSRRGNADGVVGANIPVGRYGSHTPQLVPVKPGNHIAVVRVVGDNFVSRSKKFRVSSQDRGEMTWTALEVVPWFWHSPVSFRVVRGLQAAKSLTTSLVWSALRKARDAVRR